MLNFFIFLLCFLVLNFTQFSCASYTTNNYGFWLDSPVNELTLNTGNQKISLGMDVEQVKEKWGQPNNYHDRYELLNLSDFVLSYVFMQNSDYILFYKEFVHNKKFKNGLLRIHELYFKNNKLIFIQTRNEVLKPEDSVSYLLSEKYSLIPEVK